MNMTDFHLRYLLAIHRLAQQNTEVSPLALAQVMGVTKPSVTSILTSLMKQGVIVRQRYGKIYITDRGVLYARFCMTQTPPAHKIRYCTRRQFVVKLFYIKVKKEGDYPCS